MNAFQYWIDNIHANNGGKFFSFNFNVQENSPLDKIEGQGPFICVNNTRLEISIGCNVGKYVLTIVKKPPFWEQGMRFDSIKTYRLDTYERLINALAKQLLKILQEKKWASEIAPDM